jgi:hypothetical protein
MVFQSTDDFPVTQIQPVEYRALYQIHRMGPRYTRLDQVCTQEYFYSPSNLILSVHFLDESHFSRRKLKKRKIWGLKSRRVYTKDDTLCMA